MARQHERKLLVAIIIITILLGVIALLAYYLRVVMRVKNQAQSEEKCKVVVVSSQSHNNEVKPNKLPSYFSDEYQQIGILTSPTEREGGDPMILPLFGRRINRHDRWQYYAASEKPQHLWRVPVHINGRECEETVGCPEIQNGDTVDVPIYPNRVFVASIYKLEAPQYLNFNQASTSKYTR